MKIQAIVTFAGQDQFDLCPVDAGVVGLAQEVTHPINDPVLHDAPLFIRELTRHQKIAVRVERLVGVIELHDLRVVLLLAPVGEITKEPSGMICTTFGPGLRPGQTVHQGEGRQRDESLSCQFLGRRCGRRKRFVINFEIDTGWVRRAWRSGGDALSSRSRRCGRRIRTPRGGANAIAER